MTHLTLEDLEYCEGVYSESERLCRGMEINDSDFAVVNFDFRHRWGGISEDSHLYRDRHKLDEKGCYSNVSQERFLEVLRNLKVMSLFP